MRLASLIWLAAGVVLLAQSNWPRLNYQVDPHWPRLPAGWTFEETPGIAVDAREHAFVFHRGKNSIMEFDKDGNLVRSWGDGVFVRPHGLRFDPEGNLWAADDQGHIVVKMDALGRVRMVLGRKNNKGETKDLFNRPTDLAFLPNGDFFVSDGYGNSRVVKFNKEGKFLTAWGKKGTGEGEFNLPHAVAVDKRGRVYVGDRENYRMQVFDSDGKFITQWKHVGSPWGIAVTQSDEIFMCDGHNNRILKLNLNGDVLGVLGASGKLPGQFDFVHHMALGPGGSIYTAEIKNWRAQKFIAR
ncbi:MAG: 6-bladed beta-propeller [Acidobacteria bacterium]|nr:6-bladed beta-propeller [Acidobacteriota bacterium]